MTDKQTVSFRLEPRYVALLDSWAADVGASRSELIEEAVTTGIQHMDGAPEEMEEAAAVKNAIAKNQTERRKGWFRNNFSKGLQKAFEQELHPVEYRQTVKPFLEEAKELGELPPEIQQETGCKTYIEWCEEKLEYYSEAYHGSVWSHDPIENPVGQHGGIENAREWLQRAKAIRSAYVAGDRTKAERLASYAQKDDVVPEHIIESAHTALEAGEAPSLDAAVAKEAKDAIDNSAALPGREAEDSNQ